MPRMKNGSKEIIVPIALFLMLILFGSVSFSLENEVSSPFKLDAEIINQDTNDASSFDYNVPVGYEKQPSSFWQGSRAGPDDFDLKYILGYGSMIGFLNSIKSADLDNDGIEEIVFGNAEGNIYVMERNEDELLKEWVSPAFGGNTYGLALGDTDSDATVEIVVGSADGIVRIFGWNGTAYELEWESPDLGNYAYGIDVGNVDDDVNQEIVIGTGEIRFDYDTDGGWSAGTSFSPLDENLFIFQYNGGAFEEEWSTIIPALYDGTGIYNIVIGDTDSDSINEIVIGTFEWELATGSFQGRYGIYGFDGSTFSAEWTIRELGNWIMGMGVDNTDDDNNLEIVIAVWEDAFYVYGYDDPGYTREWQSSALIPFTLAVGDTDGDDIAEILVSEDNTVDLYEYSGVAYVQSWTSGNLKEHVTGLGVGQTDALGTEELLIGDDFSILIYGNEGTNYVEYVYEESFGRVASIAAADIDENGLEELYVLSKKGKITVTEYSAGEFQIINTFDLREGDRYTSIQIADFDGDGNMEIAAVEGNCSIKYSGGWLMRSYGYSSTIFVIEFSGGEYSVVDQVDIGDNGLFTVDYGDLDDDSTIEIVVGGTNGDLIIMGYDGHSYKIEEHIHISEDAINCIGTGDTDGDGIVEIGLANDTGIASIIGFDGANYDVEWSTTLTQMWFPLALEIGSIDGDDYEEVFIKGIFSDPISIYGWNGASYDEEDRLEDYDMIFEEALLTGDLFLGNNPNFVINSFDSIVFEYDMGYSEIWMSEAQGKNAISAKISNIDNFGDNELITAYDGSILIFGTPGPSGSQPIAVISVLNDQVKVGELVEFDGSMSQGIGELEYSFDFGDGTNSGWVSTPIVYHSYSSEGTFTATLRVRDETMAQSPLVSVEITVIKGNQKPLAIIDSITPNPANEGSLVSFEGHGSDEGSISNYEWVSNINGWIGNQPNLNYSGLSSGIHNISFKVMDNEGLWSDFTYSYLRVNEIPEAKIDFISPNPGTQGDLVTFSGHGIDDGNITGYAWRSTVDDYLSSSSSFSTSSLSPGTHIIYLKVKDDDGVWSKEVSRGLEINQIPQAIIESIIPNPAIIEDFVTFTGSGTDDGSIKGYYWESDIDGFLSSSSSFSSPTLSVGEHTISLKVKDNRGVWSDIVTDILIVMEAPENVIPIAFIDSISPSTLKEGEYVTFIGHGFDDDGQVKEYLWESDIDGSLSIERSFTTSDLSVGTHVITFKVQDDREEWSEPAQTIIIVQKEKDEGAGPLSMSSIEENLWLWILIIVVIVVVIVAIAALLSSGKKEKQMQEQQVYYGFYDGKEQ